MSEVEKGLSNAFLAGSETHHKALASHHSELSEHHAAISEHHKAENPTLHKLHARIARSHAAISECHKARAEAFGSVASGLDAEAHSFLHNADQSELHRADVSELDPEIAELFKGSE
jgi:septal ring factor EnvC (AmiA/AmiB activator)